jgi:hypothetical protein
MSTLAPAYRDSMEGARIRFADLRARSLDTVPIGAASAVSAARTARIYAGVTGIAGAVLLVAATLANFLLRWGVPLHAVLLASWPAMGFAYIAGLLRGRRRAAAIAVPAQTGDVVTDLARLETGEPVAAAHRHAERLEQAATALPMIAVGLLAPLTIHLPFAASVGRDAGDGWIALSMLIVGHAHLALAFMYARFARRAKHLSSDALALARSNMEWSAWGIAVAVSAVPGIVFVLIPPVLTAVTGLLFNPILFRSMTRAILAERVVLEDVADAQRRA